MFKELLPITQFDMKQEAHIKILLVILIFQNIPNAFAGKFSFLEFEYEIEVFVSAHVP